MQRIKAIRMSLLRIGLNSVLCELCVRSFHAKTQTSQRNAKSGSSTYEKTVPQHFFITCSLYLGLRTDGKAGTERPDRGQSSPQYRVSRLRQTGGPADRRTGSRLGCRLHCRSVCEKQTQAGSDANERQAELSAALLVHAGPRSARRRAHGRDDRSAGKAVRRL